MRLSIITRCIPQIVTVDISIGTVSYLLMNVHSFKIMLIALLKV